MGIEKSLSRAQELLYWPGMSPQIKGIVEQWDICIRYRNEQTKQSLLQHEKPKRPWQKLATDLFYMNGDSHILLVEFFEVSMLKDTKSLKVMKCLRQNFARNGIPKELISDNGPGHAS